MTVSNCTQKAVENFDGLLGCFSLRRATPSNADTSSDEKALEENSPQALSLGYPVS